MRRVSIPRDKEIEILVKNRHACCICRTDSFGHEVIIHHIDGNPSSNYLGNLAVLCLDHASMADAGLKKGKLGSGKKLKPEEIKIFKKIWEKKNEIEVNSQRKYLELRERKHLELMYKYEISRVKNEILSLQDKDPGVSEKFSFLEQLMIEETISGLNLREILCEAFSDIAVQSATLVNTPCRLSQAVWSLFMHLVGPKYIKIRKEDIGLLFKSLEILETAGSFAADLTEEDRVLAKVCSTFFDLAEIASWYRIGKIKMNTLIFLKKIEKECQNYESEDKKKQKLIISRRRNIVEETIKKISQLNFGD